MMAQWQAPAVIDFGRQFTSQQMVIARTIARRELGDHEKHFTEFRRDYFWILACKRIEESGNRLLAWLSTCRRFATS